MERTDIHRPGAIEPRNYQYIGIWFEGSGIEAIEINRLNRERILAHMAKTGGKWASHEHGGSCQVCGASAVYLVVFRHEPSNEYVRVGEDCANKFDMGYDARGVSLFRHRVRDLRVAIAGKRKAQGQLEAQGLGEAWKLYTSPIGEGEQNEESVARDIVGKLVKYGSLSDKQIAFLGSLMTRVSNRGQIEAERAAKRAAEDAASKPIPAEFNDKRVTIEGVVLAERDQEGQFGVVTKILVKTDAGWKVWGTSPSNIATPRGARACGSTRGSRSAATIRSLVSTRGPRAQWS